MSDVSTQTTVRRPWGQAIATFFTCLALGPPIGGIVFAIGISLWTGIPGSSGTAATGPSDQLLSAMFVGLFSIPFSYVIGGLQAAATGLAFAVYGWLRGRPPLWFAIVTAVAVFLGAYAGGIADDKNLWPIYIAVHAVPTLLCWLIIRTYWWNPSA